METGEAIVTCPHIVTSDEGTSYCRLAEAQHEVTRHQFERVAQLEAQLAELAAVARKLPRVSWAATTEADCWGEPEPAGDDRAPWCIFDQGEDDPPIAWGMWPEDARAIAEALAALARLVEHEPVNPSGDRW